MTKVLAGITTSVDGYIAGPDDGPGKGLGEGGERLHYWVFGGPVDVRRRAEGRADRRGRRLAGGGDRRASARSSAGAGPTRRRGTGATRTPGGCRSSSSRTGPRRSRRAAPSRSSPASRRPSSERVEAAGDKDVHVMGGADVIRQALEAGLVDELTIIIAPVVLGGGKRLFEGFSQLARARAPRRAAVAVRDVHRLPGEAGLNLMRYSTTTLGWAPEPTPRRRCRRGDAARRRRPCRG